MGSRMAPGHTIDEGAHPIAASPEEKRIPFRDADHDERTSEERGRTRKRRRNGDDRGRANDQDVNNNSGTAEGSPGGGTPRKRRRSRKGLDKKFECPHKDCGKSYSRAEHLYRHQLNRKFLGHNFRRHNPNSSADTPKNFYYCDFADCDRYFVRQDLCTRHRDRHTARGSQLQRKELFSQGGTMRSPPAASNARRGSISVAQPADRTSHDGVNAVQESKDSVPKLPYTQPTPGAGPVASGNALTSPMASAATAQSNAPPVIDPQLQPRPAYLQENAPMIPLHRSSSDGSYRTEATMRGYESPVSSRTVSVGNLNEMQRHPSFGSIDALRYGTATNDRVDFVRPPLQPTAGSGGSRLGMHTAAYNQTGSQTYPGQQAIGVPGSHGTYMAHQNFPPLSTLPPPGFPTMSQRASSRLSDTTFATSPPTSMGSMDQPPGLPVSRMSVSEAALMDQMTASYSTPVFGGEGYSRSPFAMADDFAAWLFNDANLTNGTLMSPQPMSAPVSNFMDSSGAQFQTPYHPNHPMADSGYIPAIPAQHPMAVTSIVDSSPPETLLSEEKRQVLIDLITTRFNETKHAPVAKHKEALLEGDDRHVLSLDMMQKYIGSYWCHFHPQMPILHKPTFAADKTPNLLLIAIIALGASCLDKSYGTSLTQASSDLSNFLVWHLRWEVFMDSDFSPPAKLWIFQTLLLLEVYEKMYSTRALHERAHIHHATTLTLMRRGSSLLGRSALDSPPSVRDDKQTHSANGSSQASGTTTPDEWWNHWITNEATRRAAFAAFVIDSAHATMFGHSAVMVAHEMRLPLPCDEALWSATSSAEVGRVESSLQNNGIKPMTFLDGLKKSLNGQTVRTNSFGRTILMAGLLSVSWHMNQRDLQINTIGVPVARDRWRGPLTRAFDIWRRDFDETLAQTPRSVQQAGPIPYTFTVRMDEDNIFESRTVLHHLAHMAMHVDIVDCQIFARASRLLGRSITPKDYESAQRRMKVQWAPTARARDATFYALRFLSQVLVVDEEPQERQPGAVLPGFGGCEYSARDDSLLNRPWVLYFAALIVWSYGFALDGRISQPPVLKTPEQMTENMRAFLQRVGGVRSPEDLISVRGRNECLGVLMVLREMFRNCRWELLHEAANLLTNCIDMLTGS